MDNGAAEVKANLQRELSKMLQGAVIAAHESALLLEGTAKATAPFTDHTANLRNSIKGTYEVTEDSAKVVLSAGMEYAPHVEFGHFAKRNTTRWSTRKGKTTTQRISDRAFGTGVVGKPFIWPTVWQNAERVKALFAKRMKV